MRKIKQTLVCFATLFRKPLVVALTVFCVAYVDPLGIEEATADRATSTIMRLSSTLFPGSGKVSVVLIDQAYVESQPRPSWPLSYADQGVLLRQIANKEPAAVFVDLLYKNPHRNAPALLTATNASSADQWDVPGDLLGPIQPWKTLFYFAALPKRGGVKGQTDELDLDSFAPALGAADSESAEIESRLAVVSWSGYGDYYPLSLGGAGALRTPAYALYQDRCKAPQSDCADARPHYEKPMKVRWGAFVPGEFAEHINENLCQYTDSAGASNYPGVWLRLRALARQFALAVVDRADEATEPNSRLPCLSFAVLPASYLADTSNARNESLIKAALKDKFVFVGADIPGIPDRVTSPVHGQTAGVMLHAMAMENLIALETRYVGATPEWLLTLSKLVILCAVAIFTAAYPCREGGFLNAFLIVLGVCAWVGCAAFSFMHDNTARGMLFLIGGALVTWFRAAETGRVILLFIIICALALLVIEIGWEPTNWIALAVAASFVQQISSRLEGKYNDTSH